MRYVLGIETSCDETAAAVVEDGCRVVSNVVASQVDVHAVYGGVVPEIASREHVEVISQVVDNALADFGGSVDGVAVTCGPGLMGSLMVGVNFARAFSYARGFPFVGVHHIEGHIYSAFLEGEEPSFPALALIVSGGHTQLIMCHGEYRYEVLGSTRDDAVGECFDKVARLLELPYPGGPSIQKAAVNGDGKSVRFPRAFEGSESLEFSYSGLKTAVLYELRDGSGFSVGDIAASFEVAAIDALVMKTKQALAQTGAPRLIVAGGVAANLLLRSRLDREIDVPLLVPKIGLCTDNAAMIAGAGYWRLRDGFESGFDLGAQSSLSLV